MKRQRVTEGESKVNVLTPYAQSLCLNNYAHIHGNTQTPSHTHYTQKFNHPVLSKILIYYFIFIENVLETIYSKMILELNLVAASCIPCILGN